MYKNNYLALPSVALMALAVTFPISSNAQMVSTGQEKTSSGYNPIPKNQPQPGQTSKNNNNYGNDTSKGSKTKKTVTATNTRSESSSKAKAVSTDNSVLGHVKSVTSSCVKNWSDQSCMKEISSMNMTLVSTYAANLKYSNKQSYLESLKEGCAASTAALKVNVPAYAMRSAMVECVNLMSDIADKTAIRPDPTLSQLAVGSILCLGKDKSCPQIESGLITALGGK